VNTLIGRRKMKKWRQLSDREKFLNGVYSFCLGCAFYLVDCAIAPEEANHLFWMTRGVYALGPVGFIITLPLLVGGVGLMAYYGVKLLFKKEPIQLPETTRGK
jgi:hypothetical protein